MGHIDHVGVRVPGGLYMPARDVPPNPGRLESATFTVRQRLRRLHIPTPEHLVYGPTQASPPHARHVLQLGARHHRVRSIPHPPLRLAIYVSLRVRLYLQRNLQLVNGPDGIVLRRHRSWIDRLHHQRPVTVSPLAATNRIRGWRARDARVPTVAGHGVGASVAHRAVLVGMDELPDRAHLVWFGRVFRDRHCLHVHVCVVL